MRTTSKYPRLEKMLHDFLLQLKQVQQVPRYWNSYEQKVSDTLETVMPSFDRNKETANQLFRLINNSTGLQDNFTINEIRNIVKVMIGIGYNANAINSEGHSLLDVAFDFGEPEVMQAVMDASGKDDEVLIYVNDTRNLDNKIVISKRPVANDHGKPSSKLRQKASASSLVGSS